MSARLDDRVMVGRCADQLDAPPDQQYERREQSGGPQPADAKRRGWWNRIGGQQIGLVVRTVAASRLPGELTGRHASNGKCRPTSRLAARSKWDVCDATSVESAPTRPTAAPSDNPEAGLQMSRTPMDTAPARRRSPGHPGRPAADGWGGRGTAARTRDRLPEQPEPRVPAAATHQRWRPSPQPNLLPSDRRNSKCGIIVVDPMRLEPETEHPHGLSDRDYDAWFTNDKPVIFAYHGYPSLIHRLTYRRDVHSHLHVRGYLEEGTTKPIHMVMMIDLDRFSVNRQRSGLTLRQHQTTWTENWSSVKCTTEPEKETADACRRSTTRPLHRSV